MKSSMNMSLTPEENSLQSTKNRASSTCSTISKDKTKGNSNKNSPKGIPTHVEVITYVTRARKNNLSWISDIDIPQPKMRNK